MSDLHHGLHRVSNLFKFGRATWPSRQPDHGMVWLPDHEDFVFERAKMKKIGAGKILASLALFVCSEDVSSLGSQKYHPLFSWGQVPLSLKGGSGYSLVVPDDFPTMEKALKFLESERVGHH